MCRARASTAVLYFFFLQLRSSCCTILFKHLLHEVNVLCFSETAKTIYYFPLCYLDGTAPESGMVMVPPSCLLRLDKLLYSLYQKRLNHPPKMPVCHLPSSRQKTADPSVSALALGCSSWLQETGEQLRCNDIWLSVSFTWILFGAWTENGSMANTEHTLFLSFGYCRM